MGIRREKRPSKTFAVFWNACRRMLEVQPSIEAEQEPEPGEMAVLW
jgi:hypothetical protein